jgi:hypothetical protein
VILKDDSQTEKCVSSLLEASVRHGPHFDWVVAHVGGCFPDTVISRLTIMKVIDMGARREEQEGALASLGFKF